MTADHQYYRMGNSYWSSNCISVRSLWFR